MGLKDHGVQRPIAGVSRDGHGARCLGFQAGQNAKQCGLAATARADDAKELGCAYRKVDPREGRRFTMPRPERLVQIRDDDLRTIRLPHHIGQRVGHQPAAACGRAAGAERSAAIA